MKKSKQIKQLTKENTDLKNQVGELQVINTQLESENARLTNLVKLSSTTTKVDSNVPFTLTDQKPVARKVGAKRGSSFISKNVRLYFSTRTGATTLEKVSNFIKARTNKEVDPKKVSACICNMVNLGQVSKLTRKGTSASGRKICMYQTITGASITV